MHFMIYAFDNLCYNAWIEKRDIDMPKTLEENLIDYISPSLLLYSEQSNAHRFLCPYCQSSGRDKNGKLYAQSAAKGFLYKVGNAWNFRCHKCSAKHSFEKFLEIFFSTEHIEYVRLRDQLGTTGFQTNCPSLETLMRKRGVVGNPPEFHPERFHQHIQRPVNPPAAPSAPAATKVTKLPPVLTREKLAGHQAPFNRLEKQQEKRRREREGW
jgi:hypothetical protein